MYTITLTVRQVGSDLLVVAETSEPGLTSGIRKEVPLDLDLANLPDEFALTTADRRQYGQHLGKAVFHGKIRDAFKDILARAAGNEPLHVLLSIEVETLRSVRWERLCAPLDEDWKFLRLQRQSPFSIYLPSEIDKRYPTISRVELKALVVVANLGPGDPYGLAEFKAGPVVESIRQALGEIPCKVLASDAGEQLPGADGLPTLGELCRWLTVERFPILHIVCHGKYFKGDEKEPAETFLFLRKSGPIDPAKPDDHVERVPATKLIERLGELQGAKTLPHLTFLCSCETASSKAEQGLGGLGQRLVRELGMPAVVAMTELVSLPLVQQLSSEFYQRLRLSGSVDVALVEACAGISDRGEVLIPTLFSRLGGRKLFGGFGPLTTGEWENGLKRLGPLIEQRAPSLGLAYKALAEQAAAALEIRKRTETSPRDDPKAARRARKELKKLQSELNELCEGFLEQPFDALARDLPLQLPMYDTRCPFPGLGVFDVVENEQGKVEEDFRPFFFGREQLTEKVCGLLREHRFLAVLGGSGTGKSSLVRAGVLVQLREQKPGMGVIIFPPGRDPLSRLQQERAKTPAPDILVVDQFEELFTLCPDAKAREAFLAELLPLRVKCPLVITMRTDFLGECAEHDELHALLNSNIKHLELLQPLRGDELREVVEKQRNKVGLQFEPELAKRVFDDLEHEPGAMPLLQHCLRQLWNFRRGRRLCFVDYLDESRVGGVKGAIARTADEVYTKLSPAEQQLCPFIFERLVRIDTDATNTEVRRDTRQRVELSQLTPEGGDAALTKTVVSRLADAKLVITKMNPLTQATEVDVAHEALIRHWDKLQGWIANARVTARLVERVRIDAGHYYASQANPDNLTLRGVVLVEAETLLNAKPPRLTQDEALFVRLCRTNENEGRDLELRNAQEREHLALGRAEDARKSADKQRRLTQLASVVAVVAFCLAYVAYLFKNESDFNKDEAIRYADSDRKAQKETNQSESGRSSDLALGSLNREQHPIPEALHWLAASIEAEERLVLTLEQKKAREKEREFIEAWGQFESLGQQVSRSKNAEPMANRYRLGSWMCQSHCINKISTTTTVGYGFIRDDTGSLWRHPGFLWNPATNTMIDVKRLARGTEWYSFDAVFQVSTNRDQIKFKEKTLDLRSGHPGSKITNINFSRDRQFLLTSGDDKAVVVWDIPLGKPSERFECTSEAISVSFDNEAKRIVAGFKDGSGQIWTRGQKTAIDLRSHLGPILSIQFSPDGNEVVTTSSDSTVRIWDAKSGKSKLEFRGHQQAVLHASYNPSGTRLVTFSLDRTARVWDPAMGACLSELRGHSQDLCSAQFKDEHTIITTDWGGEERTWAPLVRNSFTKQPTFDSKTTYSEFASFDRQGKLLLIHANGAIQIWDVKATPPRQMKTIEQATRAAFNGSGTEVVVAHLDGRIQRYSTIDWTKSGNHFEHEPVNFLSAGDCVSWSANDDEIALPSQWGFDSGISKWNVVKDLKPVDWSILKNENGNWITATAYSQKKSLVAAGTWKGEVVIVDAEGRLLCRFATGTDWITSVTFSPDGNRVLATTFGSGAHVWRVPEGVLIASTSKTTTTSEMWPFFTDAGERIHHYTGRVSAPRFSPDGSLFIVGQGRYARVFEADNGRFVCQFAHKRPVLTAMFRQDIGGLTVLTGTDDGLVYQWRTFGAATLAPEFLGRWVAYNTGVRLSNGVVSGLTGSEWGQLDGAFRLVPRQRLITEQVSE